MSAKLSKPIRHPHVRTPFQTDHRDGQHEGCSQNTQRRSSRVLDTSSALLVLSLVGERCWMTLLGWDIGSFGIVHFGTRSNLLPWSSKSGDQSEKRDHGPIP